MSKRVAVYGMLVALAFLLSYVETLIPFSFAIQGIKLGLANLVVITALYCVGERGAFAVSMVRIVLTGLTFTSLSVMLYSLGGGLLYYFPALLAAGTVAGALIGLLGKMVTERLRPFLQQGV